jgi:hypothetical protein
VPAQQVGGDPEQPRPRVRTGPVERAPPLVRDEERLAEQVVGHRRPGAPGQVAVHHRRVPVEQRGEVGDDQVGVGGPRVDGVHGRPRFPRHIPYCHCGADRFCAPARRPAESLFFSSS